MVRCDDAAAGFASATNDMDGGGDGGILAHIRGMLADARQWIVNHDERLAVLGSIAGVLSAIIVAAETLGD